MKKPKKTVSNYSFARALLKYFCLFSLIPIMGFPYGYTVIHAHVLPTPLFIILQIVTLSVIPIFGYFVFHPIIMRTERFMMGDEMFFSRHPREYRKEVARWRKVAAHMNAVAEGEEELLPGILQLKRELSPEDAARYGVLMNSANGSVVYENEFEFNSERYDRIYYSQHPRMLRLELRLLNIKRGFNLIFRNEDTPVTPYERRLNELAEEFRA